MNQNSNVLLNKYIGKLEKEKKALLDIFNSINKEPTNYWNPNRYNIMNNLIDTIDLLMLFQNKLDNNMRHIKNKIYNIGYNDKYFNYFIKFAFNLSLECYIETLKRLYQKYTLFYSTIGNKNTKYKPTYFQCNKIPTHIFLDIRKIMLLKNVYNHMFWKLTKWTKSIKIMRCNKNTIDSLWSIAFINNYFKRELHKFTLPTKILKIDKKYFPNLHLSNYNQFRHHTKLKYNSVKHIGDYDLEKYYCIIYKYMKKHKIIKCIEKRYLINLLYNMMVNGISFELLIIFIKYYKIVRNLNIIDLNNDINHNDEYRQFGNLMIRNRIPPWAIISQNDKKIIITIPYIKDRLQSLLNIRESDYFK